jgi:uncharacterized protein (TIGR00730 family)
MRRRTGSSDRTLDERIAELVASALFDVADADLLQQAIETMFRMARSANRAEMKLVSRSMRELGRAFRIFTPYRDRRKVSIFGSARTAVGDPHYAIAKDFAHEIASRGWMVITGAGPGIMAAGHEGAGAKNSFGVGIKLPIEQSANGFIAGDPKLIDFKYFFTRKITFMKESDAFALLPGGYGTLDEAFELLTLMQTGKTAIRPVVLLQPPGSEYWSEWIAFIREHVVDPGLASLEDLSLFELASSSEEAIAIIERFYSNYDSARYVGERLVVRLKRALPKPELASINDEFRDIVDRGHIERTDHVAESRDGDGTGWSASRHRCRTSRIRQLINALNALPESRTGGRYAVGRGRMANDSIESALEIFAATGPEFGGGLSNHGPMAAEALVSLCRGEAVEEWSAWYARKLTEPPESRNGIDAAAWREALGDIGRRATGRRSSAASWTSGRGAKPWPRGCRAWHQGSWRARRTASCGRRTRCARWSAAKPRRGGRSWPMGWRTGPRGTRRCHATGAAACSMSPSAGFVPRVRTAVARRLIFERVQAARRRISWRP